MADDSINHAKQAIRERVGNCSNASTSPSRASAAISPPSPGPRSRRPAGRDIGMGSRPGDQGGAGSGAAAGAGRALRDGKLLYMAVPRLAEDPPFYELDPRSLPVPAGRRRPGREPRRSHAGSVPGKCARWTWWCAAAWR